MNALVKSFGFNFSSILTGLWTSKKQWHLRKDTLMSILRQERSYYCCSLLILSVWLCPCVPGDANRACCVCSSEPRDAPLWRSSEPLGLGEGRRKERFCRSSGDKGRETTGKTRRAERRCKRDTKKTLGKRGGVAGWRIRKGEETKEGREGERLKSEEEESKGEKAGGIQGQEEEEEEREG